MADRSATTITVYNCPDADTARAILGVLEYHGIFDTEYIGDRWPAGAVVICDPMVCLQMPIDSATRITSDLQRQAPAASWEVYQDPVHEYAGDLYRFTPELGLYTAACDGDGTAYVCADGLLGPLKHARLTETRQMLAWLRDELGETHREALRAAAAGRAGSVITAATPKED